MISLLHLLKPEVNHTDQKHVVETYSRGGFGWSCIQNMYCTSGSIEGFPSGQGFGVWNPQEMLVPHDSGGGNPIHVEG